MHVKDLTNIHAHLFTADHAPCIQLFYMVRDFILREIKSSTLLERFEQYPRGLRVAVRLAIILTWFFPCFGRKALRGLLHLFATVSRITESDVQAIMRYRGELNIHKVLIYINHEIRQYRNHPYPLRKIMAEWVKQLYAVNKKGKAVLSQAVLLEKFLQSCGPAPPYERLVALSMDFDSAFGNVYDEDFGAKDRLPDVGFAAQADELAKLAKHETRLKIIPFLGLDPRRFSDADQAVQWVSSFHKKGFQGLKMYPPLGYLPEDVRLEKVYDYCLANGLPVVSHCSKSGAGRKGALNCSELAHPYYWVPVLNRLQAMHGGKAAARSGKKRFKLCLAHFDHLERKDVEAWWDEIVLLMEYYNHPDSVIEVYADVSCTVPESRKEAKAFFKRLQGFFANPRVRSRVLFGSDWWMFIMQCEEQEYLHYTFTKWAKKSFYPDKALPDFNLRLQFEENAREFLPDQAAGKRKGAGAGG